MIFVLFSFFFLGGGRVNVDHLLTLQHMCVYVCMYVCMYIYIYMRFSVSPMGVAWNDDNGLVV